MRHGVASIWRQVLDRNLNVNQEQQQQRSPSRRRRYYDEEFKRNAVELLESGERSAVQLSRELGVSDCSLGKWKRQYGRQGREALSGHEASQTGSWS